ncbi:MAG: hypothetical protein HYU99_02375 [Deltaproteobacteria bacterium]|nr:hypothetical protein [Deltaproteobacteria bacterium]
MGNDYSSWLAQGNCTRLTSFYFSATSRWRTGGTGADSSKKGGEPQSFFSIDAWQWWSRQVTLEPEDLPEAIIVAGMASSAALQGVRNFLAPAVSTAAQTAEAALGLLFIRVPEDSIPSRPDSA